MALKKFDIPEIDDAITDARREEQLLKQQAAAEEIAAALRSFIDRSPDIINAMRAVMPMLDADKFSARVSGELRKAANGAAAQVGDSLRKSGGEIGKRLMADMAPLFERAERQKKRISIPLPAFYVIITTLVFLAAFLGIMIYANASSFHSGPLSWTIALVITAWGVCVAIVTYFSRKP